MSGNITWSEKHQGAEEEAVEEQSDEVLKDYTQQLEQSKDAIQNAIKCVLELPNKNEYYSTIIHLEESLKLLEN